MPVVYLPSDPLRSVSERPAPQRRFSAQGVVLPSPYTLPLGTHLPRRPQSSKQRERLFRVPTTPVNTRGEPNVTPRPQNPFLISSSTSAVAHNATQHSTPTHSSANAPQTLIEREEVPGATLVAEWLAEGAGIRLNDSERSARLRLCTDEAHIRSLLLEKMKRHHEILQSFEDAISEVTHTEQLCRYTMKECEATARSALGTIFRALTAALLFRIAEREREELQENERRIERSEWETRCMLGSSWCLEISALWTQFKTKRDCISCTTDEANSRRAIICDEVHSLGVWQLNLRASFQAVEASHTTQRCEALARESVESQQWFEWQALLARETAFRLAVHVWSLEKVERVFITDAEHAAWTLLLTRDSEGFRNAMGHQRLLRWLLAQQEADRLEIMAEESSVRHQSWKELAITIEQLEKINPHIAGCPFHRKKDCPFFGHRNIVHVPVPLEPPLVL